MANNLTNSSSYVLYIAEWEEVTPATPGNDIAWTDYETASPTWVHVPYISGATITTDGRTKDITSLGDGAWASVVRERLGATISVTLEHIVDDMTDAIEPGQLKLAEAAEKVGLGGRTLVRYDHPFAGATGLGAANNDPGATGFVTVFTASVQGGHLRMGSGGTNGSFSTSAYDLVSMGPVTTLALS